MKRRFNGVIKAGVLALAISQLAAFTSFAYSFSADGVEISMNQDASELLSELGKAKKYYEADSCKHQGKEKVFTYEGYELSTYPSGKNDYVKSVYFLKKDLETPEGIHIGSTIDEMKETYGEDYTEEKGRYKYTEDGCVLTFYTKKGVVSGIEYMAEDEQK